MKRFIYTWFTASTFVVMSCETTMEEQGLRHGIDDEVVFTTPDFTVSALKIDSTVGSKIHFSFAVKNLADSGAVKLFGAGFGSGDRLVVQKYTAVGDSTSASKSAAGGYTLSDFRLGTDSLLFAQDSVWVHDSHTVSADSSQQFLLVELLNSSPFNEINTENNFWALKLWD